MEVARGCLVFHILDFFLFFFCLQADSFRQVRVQSSNGILAASRSDDGIDRAETKFGSSSRTKLKTLNRTLQGNEGLARTRANEPEYLGDCLTRQDTFDY